MDGFKFSCPKCGGHIAVEKEMAHRAVNCPHCRANILIPGGGNLKPSSSRKRKRWLSLWMPLGLAVVISAAVLGAWAYGTHRRTQMRMYSDRATNGGSSGATSAPALPPKKDQPSVKGSKPEPTKTNQAQSPINLNVTMMVVGIESATAKIASIGAASIAATLSSDGKIRYEYDKPGSLWLAAKGGASYGGTKLLEGRIYLIDDSRQPRLTAAGDYSAWISYRQSQEVYPTPDKKTRSFGTLSAGETMQLLLASENAQGWHRVRLKGAPEVDGWVMGGWESLAFKKRLFARARVAQNPDPQLNSSDAETNRTTRGDANSGPAGVTPGSRGRVGGPNQDPDPLPSLPEPQPEGNKATQPTFMEQMPEGPNSVTVVNKLGSWIGLGVFCGRTGSSYRYGAIGGLPARDSITLQVPNGTFYLYYIRQDKPSIRYRNPRSVVLRDGENWRVTIGTGAEEKPVEESF